MKLNIKRWEWNGMKLVPLHVMAWRALWYPLAFAGRIVYVAGIAMALGAGEGKKAWEDTK